MAQDFEQQIYQFLMQSQYFSAEQLRAQQLHQLEQLVRHARREVSFYNTRLAPVFDRQDRFCFENWTSLPILKRADLLQQREAMLAVNLPPGHGPAKDFTGTGTTGQSITIRQSILNGVASRAALFRAWNWHGYDFGKNFFAWFGADEDDARWPEGRIEPTWGPSQFDRPGYYAALHRLEPVERAFAFMRQHKAAYVSSRPHALLELAYYAESEGIAYRIDGLTGFGANVTDTMREDCRRIFGSPIRSLYASKEAYNIAHECPAGLHHINAELMLVEVLDEADRPCPPGQRGRIVVTPFYGTAQPLIRYEMGDEVTLGEGCSCGCNLPVIAELNGRTFHLFRLPGGRKVALRLPAEIKRSFGAREWQVAQVAPEIIEIRYLKLRNAEPAELEKITSLVRQQMTATTKVVFKPVFELPQTASGKVLDFVCELPTEV
jgi:phenylacetate-CoA ligase